jgi:hypothetical protein
MGCAWMPATRRRRRVLSRINWPWATTTTSIRVTSFSPEREENSRSRAAFSVDLMVWPIKRLGAYYFGTEIATTRQEKRSRKRSGGRETPLFLERKPGLKKKPKKRPALLRYGAQASHKRTVYFFFFSSGFVVALFAPSPLPASAGGASVRSILAPSRSFLITSVCAFCTT